jgi:hypothetical protein
MTPHWLWARRHVVTWLMVLATLAYGCTLPRDAEPPDALIVAPESTNVEFIKLGPLWQVYYDVKAPYPAEDVLHWLREQLARRGWQPLNEDFLNPGLPSSHVTGWQSFGDYSTKSTRAVHQWLAQWQDANGAVVVYALQYRTTEIGTLDLVTLHVLGSYSTKAVAEEQRKAAAALRTRGN